MLPMKRAFTAIAFAYAAVMMLMGVSNVFQSPCPPRRMLVLVSMRNVDRRYVCSAHHCPPQKLLIVMSATTGTVGSKPNKCASGRLSMTPFANDPASSA